MSVTSNNKPHVGGKPANKCEVGLLDIYRNPMAYPKKGDSLDSFLELAGFTLTRAKGEKYSRQIHQKHFSQLVKDNKNIAKVCEIGFNMGHSSLIFLNEIKNREGNFMVSFDILQHNHVYYSKLFVDINFPDKHILIGGDSSKTVPTFNHFYPTTKFDLIFVNGDHTERGAYQDIINMKNYAHRDTFLIIDNVAPHCTFGKGVFKAWKRALEENIITHVEHIEIDDFRDGFAFCRYNFDNSDPREDVVIVDDLNNSEKLLRKRNRDEEDEIEQNLSNKKRKICNENNNPKLPDFSWIKRRKEITRLKRKLNLAKDLNELNQIRSIICKLKEVKDDRVDQWASQEIASLERELGDRFNNLKK